MYRNFVVSVRIFRFHLFFSLDLNSVGVVNRSQLITEILDYAAGPPFNCMECQDIGVVS
jgi:hypothetical protein